MHSLIRRQIKSYLKDTASLPEEFQEFIKAVDKAYHENDADRLMLERAFDLSSQELIQVNEELRESEEKYRLIAENTADLIVATDMNLRFTYISPSIMRTHGYTVEEAMNMTLEQFMTPESMQILLTVFEEEMKLEATGTADPGRIRVLEVEEYKKDGSIICLELSVSSQRDKENKMIGILSVNRDITERKQAEKKLINSEEKFRMLAESSSFAIMMHQGDRWIYANRAAEEISGYTEKELCGMHFWDIVHPDYRDMVKQSGFNRQQGKVLPRAYEFKIIAKNGLEKWVILTGSPIQYEDKATALISVTDITERKITEAALMESEIKYRRIFESFEDLYYQTDEKGIIRVLSPSLYRLTGWSPDELIGKPVTDVYVSPKDRKKLLAEISRSGFLRDYEVFLKKKDGTQTYASLTASILTDSDGRPCGTSGTLRDITERKRLESQREVMLEALRDSEKRYLELSIIDDLTQLYNSRHFHAQLEREIERSNRYGQPLTLLLLDIDKFKDFNDTYGHVQGDYVLSRLGHAIKRSLREIDSAYRYGGEEFTIILPMTMSEEGIVTAKRIQKELRKENFSPVLGQEVYITVSIGLAQYKPKEEIKAFVHRVDQFMYKVKKNERGKICSDDGNIR
jgi:diguanylate cyclase (GGDEF)-like protein/PAS domain S-box-containing protein